MLIQCIYQIFGDVCEAPYRRLQKDGRLRKRLPYLDHAIMRPLPASTEAGSGTFKLFPEAATKKECAHRLSSKTGKVNERPSIGCWVPVITACRLSAKPKSMSNTNLIRDRNTT